MNQNFELVRTNLAQRLWRCYAAQNSRASAVESLLASLGQEVVYDHLAFVEIPGQNSGITPLRELFETLGYEARSAGYLAEKYNDFIWLSEKNASSRRIEQVGPQIVLADFRSTEMSGRVAQIVEKYAHRVPVLPVARVEDLVKNVEAGGDSGGELEDVLYHTLTQRSWELPTVQEYQLVAQENELLARTLLFGRGSHHFALAVHRMRNFGSLDEFNQYLQSNGIAIYAQDGKIKGDVNTKLEQSSSVAPLIEVACQNGILRVAEPFVEYVWRHPLRQSVEKWNDLYQDFLQEQADKVVQTTDM